MADPSPPLDCALCSSCFTSTDELARHYAHHNPPVRFHVCDTCDQGFFTQEKLEQHTRRHRATSARRPYFCDVCLRQFGSEDAFQAHLPEHTDYYNQKCDICGKQFEEKLFLQVHRLTHLDQKPHRCEVCGKLFVLRADYVRHTNSHKDGGYPDGEAIEPDVYVCDICRQSFDSSKSLEWHVKTHDPFKCDVCLQFFHDRPTYMKHRNHHKLSEGRVLPETCTICQKEFQCGIQLLQHIARHEADKLLRCEYCGKLFQNATRLKRHHTIHEKKISHGCDICGKVLEERIFFEIHRLTHFEQKPFPCDICDDIFDNKTAYLRHRNNHKVKKPRDTFRNMREALKQKLDVKARR